MFDLKKLSNRKKILHKEINTTGLNILMVLIKSLNNLHWLWSCCVNDLNACVKTWSNALQRNESLYSVGQLHVTNSLKLFVPLSALLTQCAILGANHTVLLQAVQITIAKQADHTPFTFRRHEVCTTTIYCIKFSCLLSAIHTQY